MPQVHDHRKPGVQAMVCKPGQVRRVFCTPGPAKAFLAKALDVVLPAQCLGCRTIVETAHTICAPCWASLNMIGPAVCGCCGLPFSFAQDEALCAECLRLTPPFVRSRSAVVYDDASRHMIMAFKHGDRPEAAHLFARWMISCAPDLLQEAHVLVPVPLDSGRLFKRRYNQAALLAQRLSAACARPVGYDLVERIRPTPSQGRLTPAQRRRNVAGAFAVPEAHKAKVSGQRILLVDDVYTTGATVRAITRQLNKAGARAVDVLTIARVVRTGESRGRS